MQNTRRDSISGGCSSYVATQRIDTMIAQTPRPHNPTVRVVTVALPRPAGPVDTGAHLRELGTSLAPGPPLHLRPRDQRGVHRLPHGLLPGLALALLGLALLIAPVAAAGRTPGYVSHVDDREGAFLGTVVADLATTREARDLDDALDARALEEQFDVTILEEIVFTRTEARGIGVDAFRSMFFVQGFATSGMINVARDGSTVILLIYVATEDPDFDAALTYQGRVFEDGIDARAPFGFEEYEYDEDAPAFETSSL